MRMETDRRAHPRARLRGTARVHLGADTLECRIVDVSAVGMAVRCRQGCATGRYVQVRFRLSEQHEWHEADGEVARVEPRRDGWTLGIEFTVIDASAVADIVVYVEQKRALEPEEDLPAPRRPSTPKPVAARTRPTSQYGIYGTREQPKPAAAERNAPTGEHRREPTKVTRSTERDLEVGPPAIELEDAPADETAQAHGTTQKMPAVAASKAGTERDKRRTTEREIQQRPTQQYRARTDDQEEQDDALRPTQQVQRVGDGFVVEPRRGVSGRPIGPGPVTDAAARERRERFGASTVSGGRIDRRLLNLYLEALAGVEKAKRDRDEEDDDDG